MSLNTAFREAEDIKRLQKVIEKRVEEIGRPLRIMEFCGGHTHTIKLDRYDSKEPSTHRVVKSFLEIDLP